MKVQYPRLRLQPVTTNNVVTYVVIISAPNPDKKLMPGMTASTIIYVEEKESTIIIAGKAVRFTPDQSWLAQMAKERESKMREGPENAGGIPPPGMRPANDADVLNKKNVWIKDENGLIRPVMITTGIDNGSSVEIL